MLYLISYDIPSSRPGNRRRARLARFLTGRGIRVQMSVFEVELSPERLPILMDEISQFLDPFADSVRVYPLCAACTQRVQHLGIEAVVEREGMLVW